MPLETLRWLDRLKGVEREYRIVRLATDRLAAEAAHDPTILGRTLRVREIGPASQRLEGTYVVRLFAEFETAPPIILDLNTGDTCAGQDR